MSNTASKVSNIVLWVFLITLLVLSAFMNLISVLIYSRNASLFVLGLAVLLMIIKFITERSSHIAIYIVLALFCLLFLTNSLLPKQKFNQIAKDAGLDLPPNIKILFFAEIIGFVGSEDSYNITISLSKKHLIPFTKPFWPTENITNKIVFDEERDGLPITIMPNNVGPETFEGFIKNIDQIDPNEFYEMRGKVNQSFEIPDYEIAGYQENNNAFWNFVGMEYNKNHKHWSATKENNYVNLFLDLEKEDTATAFMYITIY